ncbi:conserved hypothetical proline rich protein [Amycolatopsis camponoti]|uniref:Conserved hypothetical proline rich protein n=1 Tax=Amycolatopsis camponoti TaxID=2606593 RepID=A0A6I8LLX1_9PSEU|nr:hypothetical protein [Amycolatopsis camponoti]VVJ17388.1 conserved hypothetical proline rich protein [Amycolatopsis camponoti]
MTRRARRRRDRVTVDELLREAGARPRKPGSRSAEVAARRDPDAEPHGAAGRIALASAVIVVLGGLVLALATRTEPAPGSRQFPQLQPATGVPTATSTAIAVPTRTTTPSPVVMHARQTPTPTPTVTVDLPPSPTTTVTLPTFTPDYRCYPYGCRRDGTPVR